MKYLNSDDENMSKAMGWGAAEMAENIRNSIKTCETLRDIAASGQKHAEEYKLGVGNLADPFSKKIERLQGELAFYEAQL